MSADLASAAIPDPLSANQPPPAIITHTYTFPPTLARYNIPLAQLLEENAPRDRAGVGAYVFRTATNAEMSSESEVVAGKTKEENKQLLLIRRSAQEAAFPEMYEVPGGGAEPPPIDATILDSVARELFEETGLRAKRIVGLIDTADFEGRRGDRWRKFNFEVEVEDHTNVVLQPAEHDEYKWVSKEEYEEQERLGESGWLGKTMPSQQVTLRRAFGLDV